MHNWEIEKRTKVIVTTVANRSNYFEEKQKILKRFVLYEVRKFYKRKDYTPNLR